MAVAFCQLPVPQFHVLNHLTPTLAVPPRQSNTDLSVFSFPNKDDEKPDQSTILFMIQCQKPTSSIATAPYVHPLVRRSSRLMSMTSLEMCTESLGSESGSGDFSDFDRGVFNSSRKVDDILVKQKIQQSQRSIEREKDVDQQNSVNYHFSVNRLNHAPRSFPPPLPSISRRDGTCIQMKARRQDGRLVVDAVPAASRNYLHASRYDGRLLLSFMDSTTNADTYDAQGSQLKKEQLVGQSASRADHDTEADDEEDDEEEVEVVDRGSMVEVKVSTQSQHESGEKKVIRSSLVINKFVSGTPSTNQNRWVKPHDESRNSDTTEASRPSSPVQRRLAVTTTTAAAAAVAASSVSGGSPEVLGLYPDNKLLYTSKRRNREELLKQMRWCSELRRPLFFWESGGFASSGGCLSC